MPSSADLTAGSASSGYAMQFVNVQHTLIQQNIAARNNRFHNVHTLSLEGASRATTRSLRMRSTTSTVGDY